MACVAKIMFSYTQIYYMDTHNMIALGCWDCRLKYLLAPFGLSVVLCGIASTFLSILSSDESFFFSFICPQHFCICGMNLKEIWDTIVSKLKCIHARDSTSETMQKVIIYGSISIMVANL